MNVIALPPRDRPVGAGKPLVSVFIAAYNCAAYIGSAIESVLDQQGVPLEILVVDDASSDATAAIARSYADRGPVRVFVNPDNRGPSYSRNRAIGEARGEWLAQLDGDDWFAPGRLVALLDWAERSGADVVADDMYLVADATLTAGSTRFIENGALLGEARLITAAELVRFDLGSIKPIMRRDRLLDAGLRYPEDVRYGEDFLFLLRALMAGARMLIVPTPMYHLRRGNTGSATTRRTELFAQVRLATRGLMADAAIRCRPEVLAALAGRLAHVDRLAALEDVVRLAKTGRMGAAMGQLLREPALLAAFLRRAPEVLGIRARRLRYRGRLAGAVRPPVAALPISYR